MPMPGSKSIMSKLDDFNIQNAVSLFIQIMNAIVIFQAPTIWHAIWKKYIEPTNAKHIMPLILSSWWQATDQEPNERLIAQLNAIFYEDKKTKVFDFLISFDHKNEWLIVPT